MLPAFFGQANAKVYYNLDETLKPDMSSIVALNKMKDNFNMTSTHFIIVKDDIKSYKMKEMTDRIENLEGVTTVLSYDKFIGPNVPEDFIPRDIKEIFKQGGYNLLLVNSEYKSASDELNNQIIEMTDIVKSYDKERSNENSSPRVSEVYSNKWINIFWSYRWCSISISYGIN